MTTLVIPYLTSDVLLVFDCYVEGISAADPETQKISFLLDDDEYWWARYATIFAGYKHDSNLPGKFSELFMSALEDLAESQRRGGYIDMLT